MMARLAGMTGPWSRRRAADLLERFDLGAAGDRRVSTYSGGMRQRLDLAAGLVGRPAVLFHQLRSGSTDGQRGDRRECTFGMHVATLDDVFLALTGKPADQSEKESAHV